MLIIRQSINRSCKNVVNFILGCVRKIEVNINAIKIQYVKELTELLKINETPATDNFKRHLYMG